MANSQGFMTIPERDRIDLSVGAISDYAAMLRLISETTKKIDDDIAASIERIGWELDRCVGLIRDQCDELQQEGATE
jgi:hypothetical protein